MVLLLLFGPTLPHSIQPILLSSVWGTCRNQDGFAPPDDFEDTLSDPCSLEDPDNAAEEQY